MHYNFIEIGSSDIETCVETSTDNTVGICVEPVSKYLNNIPAKSNIFKLNAAISDGTTSSVDIYYLNDESLKRFPIWARGCNTVNKIHPLIKKHLEEMKLKIEDCIVIDKVRAYTLKEIFEMYNVTSLEYLKIDTEGYDCYIMEQYYNMIINNPSIRANKIMFETNEWSDNEYIKKIKNMFINIGYKQTGDIDANGNSWPNTILIYS